MISHERGCIRTVSGAWGTTYEPPGGLLAHPLFRPDSRPGHPGAQGGGDGGSREGRGRTRRLGGRTGQTRPRCAPVCLNKASFPHVVPNTLKPRRRRVVGVETQPPRSAVELSSLVNVSDALRGRPSEGSSSLFIPRYRMQPLPWNLRTTAG